MDLGGSPGLSDTIPFNGVSEDDQYALGPAEAFAVKIIDEIPYLEFSRSVGTDDVTIIVEVSEDLKT